MQTFECREKAAPDAAARNLSGAIRLRCPVCGAGAVNFHCTRCDFVLTIARGIVDALSPVRAFHYAKFIADYERIRDAEGRGSERDAFYLNLPYRDISGRYHEQWQIRRRTFDCLTRNVLPVIPAEARILDLGAGNCWLSFRLAHAGHKPAAVDLLTNGRDGLGAAEHYRGALPGLFPRFRAELENLPFQDNQFDAAIFNASFHYAEDAEKALGEALRCVKKEGWVIISDTPWYSGASSGEQMVRERRARFLKQHGTASASIASLEYLTDDRLLALEERLRIRWETYFPKYGVRWALRPLLARVRRRREPARFRIYAAQKHSA